MTRIEDLTPEELVRAYEAHHRRSDGRTTATLYGDGHAEVCRPGSLAPERIALAEIRATLVEVREAEVVVDAIRHARLARFPGGTRGR